jgi:hypothetical protein
MPIIKMNMRYFVHSSEKFDTNFVVFFEDDGTPACIEDLKNEVRHRVNKMLDEIINYAERNKDGEN